MRPQRILASAIIFSALWHIFWLSALTVVIVPKDTKPLKFSSVSFLGPILEQSVLKVNTAAQERSIPEIKYTSDAGDMSGITGKQSGYGDYMEADIDAGVDTLDSDEYITNLAISVIDEDKIEP